jgi:hypothetical protein
MKLITGGGRYFMLRPNALMYKELFFRNPIGFKFVCIYYVTEIILRFLISVTGHET